MLFNETTLRKLSQLPFSTAIYLFPKINSTNSFLLEQASIQKSAFCLAESQSAGRGQHGRTWVSPKAQNIYLSYLTYSPLPRHQLQDLSLQTGEVLLSYLNQHFNLKHLRLKWPNDLLFKEQKLAGILVETKPIDTLTAIVIGIGLNVNMQEPPEMINQPWTSLTKITHNIYDLNHIAAGLMQNLALAFPTF